MSRAVFFGNALVLGIFWSPILLAWSLVWYRFRDAPNLVLWITLAVLLGLIAVSVTWFTLRAIRTRSDRLPWYLVIGPRGSGKATLLKTSGLRPLSVQDDESLVAQRSIILEGIGGFVLDDAQDTDTESRQQFLYGLRQFLRAKSLKGIIATLEAEVALDAEGNQEQAEALRDHLSEISELLGVHLPVYLVITKCDCLPGFLPFFANLPPAERDEVWGVTLPVGSPRHTLASFRRECHTLQSAIDERRLGCMGSDSITANKAIYHFPMRFRDLCNALGGFIQTLLAGQEGWSYPVVRGYYWTSAAQPKAEDLQCSFFVKELLSKVLRGDLALAQPTRKAMRQRWTRRMALSGIATLIGSLLVWALPNFSG
jgi:type VI protein secretion system component VasK